MSPIETLGAAGDGVQSRTREKPGLGIRPHPASADSWAFAAITASLRARHGRDADVISEDLAAAGTADVSCCDGNTCPSDRCCSDTVPDGVLVTC